MKQVLQWIGFAGLARNRPKILFLVSLVVLLGGLTAWYCHIRDRSFRLWVTEMEYSRSEVLADVKHTPYQTDQMSSINVYFAGVKEKADALASDHGLQKRFNRFLVRDGVDSFCSKTLISKAQWDSVVRNCTRSGFFLCAPEAKGYATAVVAFHEAMEPELRRRFDETDACKVAL